jgi:hypothetical protein
MRISYRVHEWLADRIPSVQYPRVRRLTPPQRASTSDAGRLPVWKAIVLAQWFLLALLAGAVMLGFGLLLAVIFLRVLLA